MIFCFRSLCFAREGERDLASSCPILRETNYSIDSDLALLEPSVRLIVLAALWSCSSPVLPSKWHVCFA